MLWLGKRKPHWILFQLLTLRLKPRFEQYCTLQYLPEEVPSVLRLINRAGQAGCLPGKPSESGQQLAQRNTLKKTSDWARTNKAEMRRDGSGIHSSHQPESHGQVAQAIFKTSDWKVRLSSKKELCVCSPPKKRINLSTAEDGAPVRPFWSATYFKCCAREAGAGGCSYQLWGKFTKADPTECLLSHRLKEPWAFPCQVLKCSKWKFLH